MRFRKKIFLAFLITIFLLLGSLIGAILYLYYHPSTLKPFIEASISRSTGSAFTIKELSYSIKPLSIRAKGILFNPLEEQHGLHLEVPELMADLSLEGPFGNKSLTFKSIKIDAFSLLFSKEMGLPQIAQEEKSASFVARILKGGMGFFLFKDIKFQGAELTNGQIAARLGDQIVLVTTIHAKLNPDHRMGISCRIQMRWLSQKVGLTAPDVHITTDHAISFIDPEIRGVLTAQKVTFKSPKANVKSMEVKATLVYNYNEKKLAFEPMNILLGGITIEEVPEGETIPLNLNLKTEGFFNLRSNHLDASHFQLDVNDIVKVKGRLNLSFGPQTILKVEQLDAHFLPQKLLPLLPDKMQPLMAPFNLSGHVSIVGEIDGQKDQQKWSWHPNLEARFKQNPFSYGTEEIQFQGRITGKIQAEGKLPGLRISTNMEGDMDNFSGKGVELKPFKASLSLSGKHPKHLIKNLTAHIPQAKVAVGERDVLIDNINLRVLNGKLDGGKKSLVLPEIRLDSSLLKNLLLSLTVDGEQVVLGLQGKAVHLIESAFALNFLPSSWQFSGVDSIQARATFNEKGIWSFTSELGFQDFGFQNQDSSFLGEKISIRVKTAGEFDLKGSHLSAHTTLELDGGELLYDRFYLDLNSNGFFSSWEGTYDLSKKSLELSSLSLGLKDILTLDVNGTLLNDTQAPHFRLSVNIPKTSLKPAFHHFILEPFQAEKPFLTNLNIGGTLSANLNLTGTRADWTVTGNCIWNEGELSSEEKGFSFQGIDLDLPVWFQSSAPSPFDSTERHDLSSPTSLVAGKGEGLGGGGKERAIKGELSIQSVLLPMLPKQSLTVPLDAAGPNQLSVRSPTILRIPGGAIQLGPMVFRDILVSQPSIETSLTLDSVDLHPLLSGIWSRAIQGKVEGKLDPIHFKGNTISSLGRIKAKLFGGEIILSDFGATGVFTSTPAFQLNARWNNLNLAEMTTGTSFGKIEGILKGHINDLDVAYGQPQKFDLLLETVKKKGVSQRISVKALDNIAQIGGGHSPFMGVAGAFASFFREFPYKKIGIRASLENDVFRINGTIREGGKEYLVKKGIFSGVNVVNQNPDNRISFKDMLKRLKRVTSSSSGPVVK